MHCERSKHAVTSDKPTAEIQGGRWRWRWLSDAHLLRRAQYFPIVKGALGSVLVRPTPLRTFHRHTQSNVKLHNKLHDASHVRNPQLKAHRPSGSNALLHKSFPEIPRTGKHEWFRLRQSHTALHYAVAKQCYNFQLYTVSICHLVAVFAVEQAVANVSNNLNGTINPTAINLRKWGNGLADRKSEWFILFDVWKHFQNPPTWSLIIDQVSAKRFGLCNCWCGFCWKLLSNSVASFFWRVH